MKKAKNIGELSSVALKCRVLTHPWEVEYNLLLSETEDEQITELHVRCGRCKSVRLDTVRNGRVTKRRYGDRPDNYLLDAPTGSVADRNAEIRSTLLAGIPLRREDEVA